VVREAITTEPVNWALDADIRRYFDSVDRDWLMRMLADRVAETRVLRVIGQWLRAGILEDGVYADTVEGTPQSAGISPLLATSSCIMCSISGWNSGSGGIRPVRYGWSDMPTTTCSYSSDGRMRNRNELGRCDGEVG
jgi:hypothetical protein